MLMGFISGIIFVISGLFFNFFPKMKRSLVVIVVLAFSVNGLSQVQLSVPGPDNELINGKEYFPYYSRSRNKPVLFANEGSSRSVITATGRKYDNLSLFYDTYTGEVVYMDTSRLINSNVLQIVLNRNIIDSFSYYLPGDTVTFRYFSNTDDTTFNLDDGFYEVAYKNKVVCLIKHRSVVHEKNGIDEYYYKPVTYIKAGDGYFNTRTIRQFLRFFGDKEGKLKEMIRKQKVNFRKADKKQIAALLRNYEQLMLSQ